MIFAQKSLPDAVTQFNRADEAWRFANTDDEWAKAARETYQAIADACQAYADPRHLQSAHPQMFPASIAQALYALVGGALRGHRDDTFESLFVRGAPSNHPLAEIDMARGCIYIQAVEAGLIKDRTKIKTVADWFGVSRKTVHDWKKTIGADDLLSDTFPDSGNRAELITAVAQMAGERYRHNGRGLQAIELRSRKNQGVNQNPQITG
ncbi:MAG TPA: hypothetical protein VGJ08_01730 [Rhizomicrobium sp.]|jgi:hypothetical protein